MIWVNFKTYSQSTGQKAVELAKICEEVSRVSGVEIIPVVQAVDLFRVSSEVRNPVWVQHVDPYLSGQSTGWVTVESALAGGACGTILNHAEHQIPPGTIKQIISQISNLKTHDFKIMVCAKTLGQAERLAKLKPDDLAYEPPELIGGDLSVAKVEPNVIRRIINRIPEIPIVVGAGIKSSEDVKRSIQLGAVGVLVSSGVVLAHDQKEALEELVGGFK